MLTSFYQYGIIDTGLIINLDDTGSLFISMAAGSSCLVVGSKWKNLFSTVSHTNKKLYYFTIMAILGVTAHYSTPVVVWPVYHPHFYRLPKTSIETFHGIFVQ